MKNTFYQNGGEEKVIYIIPTVCSLTKTFTLCRMAENH